MVLVVDDDIEARTQYCASLDAMGYRTAECGDGSEAVDEAQRRRPDVVLMDMSMPDVDGVEATRRLKARAPDTFVVGMSGLPERYFHLARGSGCDAFLGKPFNPYVLEEILTALRRRKDVEVIKLCGCGREHTRAGWKALHLCGEMGGAELRNCICGSSLALREGASSALPPRR
jgi:two-component system, cell cycle response regulator DivK